MWKGVLGMLGEGNKGRAICGFHGQDRQSTRSERQSAFRVLLLQRLVVTISPELAPTQKCR